METGSKLTNVELGDGEVLSCITVHPDGLMMATGSSSGIIRVWDIRTQGVVATLEEHKSPIKSLKFSVNAIQLASISESENEPLLWNLKKLNQSPPQKLKHSKGLHINSIDFDPYGHYIVAA